MRKEGIPNQGAMASPGNRLGAHNSRPLGFAHLHQPAQALSKFAGLHVVGIAAKAGVTPTGVEGVLKRMAQAAQGFHVDVADPSLLECRSDAVAIELGVVPGLGNGPYICELLYTVRLQ